MATATRYLGTCPVCYRQQKLRNSVMVLHGYTRPGHGYINGTCYGVGWAPFEVSPDGTIAYVERVLQPMLDNSETFLQKLLAGTVTEVYVEVYVSREKQLNRLTRDDGHKFNDAVRNKTRSTQVLIRQLTEDIAERTQKVARWKREPIQTEQEVVQQRERMTSARRAVLDDARAAKQAKRTALDAKQRARDQEALDLIEEYRNIFEQLAHSASPRDREEAKRHWIKMFKRMSKKSYLHFYPHKLEADEALERLGLATPVSWGNGMSYSNDLGWPPTK